VREIDAIDQKILAALQNDGRITNVDLAARVGISAPPCLRRKQELEDYGFIRGYYADVDPAKVGYEVSAFLFIGLVSQTNSEVEAFGERIRLWPLVREAFALSGNVDFLLHCIAPNLRAFQVFLTETVMKSPGVLTVRTAIAIHVVKRSGRVPFLE